VLAQRYNQRGFTLVELMIGVVIMGILLAAAIPNYKDWIQNAQIRTAAESISAGLQLARAEAIRRNKSVQFTLTGLDSSWTFGCVNWDTDGDGLADDIDPADGVDDCPSAVQSRDGREGTNNAVIAVDNAQIVFNGLGRAAPIMTVNVSNPAGGACLPAGTMRCLNNTVTAGGQIRMCDPLLSILTDPQGC
jgi:type IV fimbrial biogenesis protein FimT